MSLPPLVFFSLTPEEDEDSYIEEEEDVCTWIDDSECQENLFHILPLTPEETRIDKDNHIHTTFKLFFEELGYLTEEPEPIDPTRDYEAEAKELLSQRDCKKMRQKHVELSATTPSLDESINSGVSSSCSSVYHDTNHFMDIRSPYYIGYPMMKESSAYHYRASRLQNC